MTAPPILRPQHIELPVFSGPLDLLLHLIERSELDITAVSLAKVTAQYLAQIEEMKQNRIEQLVDFLVIGAQLVLIKSRALLPKPPAILLQEGEEEEDPAEALARRLRVYKQFKDAAVWLKERDEAGLRSYLRVAPAPPHLRPRENQLDLSGVTVETLYTAVLEALSRAENLEESVSVAAKPRFTIEGQLGRLRRLLHRYDRVGFRDLLSGEVTRSELSVTLLAVLETVKRREAITQQAEMFGPIEIVRLADENATYDT
ncbi:MAG: segregation/condensation protein A [Anaerolineales bacterium]|nr:segregation/condensation protein A [Anaerolineales bacterium]